MARSASSSDPRIVGSKVTNSKKSPNGDEYDGETLSHDVSTRQADLVAEIKEKRKQMEEKQKRITKLERQVAQLTAKLARTREVANEINERKRIEQELRESEERWETMAKATFEGLAITEKGRFIDVNDQFSNITGYGRSDLLGTEVTELLHEDDRKWIMENIMSGREGVTEHRMIHKDGRVVTVEAHAKIVDYKGRKVRLAAIRDITERKQMEEELRQSHKELELRVIKRTTQLRRSEETARQQLAEIEAYYNMAPIGLAILDRQLRYVRVNQRLAEMNGIPIEEHIGRTLHEVVPKKVADWFEGIARRVLETGEPIRDIETTTQTDGALGAERAWRMECFPISDFDERRIGLGVILAEITESKKLEDELRQSQKMQALGTLAGGIAHDFNNMLAIIIGNAELALDDIQESDPRRNLEAILGASMRSRDLVKQILTFSRKRGTKQIAVDLRSLLDETHGLLRSTLPATIRIELDVDAKQGLAVMGDPSMIQQIILNLASNAAYAMREKGGVLTIGLSVVDHSESGSFVKLTVADTGTGIAPDIRRRIFEPFFTTKEPGQGTGMGLSVVYGIVEDCNGMIAVESKVGGGTIFTVLFPRANIMIEDESPNEGAPITGREHILLVDDEAGFIEMIVPMLERLGYRVTSATDSVIAMRIFITSPEAFDLIITDQTMPDFTGIEFAREVRCFRKDLPVILCTGYSEIVSSQIAKEAGVAEFLMKPIRKKQMAQAIRRVLDNQKTSRGAAQGEDFQS